MIFPLSLLKTVATRWWTTYSKLERLFELRTAIRADVNEKYLTGRQLVLINGIVQLLKPFMTVQKLLEGDTYVTMPVLPIMIHRFRIISNEAGNVYDHMNNTYSLVNADIVYDVKAVGTCMLHIFEEHWRDGVEGNIFPSRGPRNIRVDFPSFIWRKRLYL